MKLLLAILVLPLVLAGCGTLGLSADQYAAMKDLSVSTCIKSPGWNGSPVEIHVVSNGGTSTGSAGGSTDVSCGSSIAHFNNEGKALTLPAGTQFKQNPDGTLTVVKPPK